MTITAEGVTLAGGSGVRWALVRSAKVVKLAGERCCVLLPRRECIREARTDLTPSRGRS